eukprot:2186039-Pleurochrysis_carterae.AAC.1
MQLATASTASSWPMTRARSRSAILSSRVRSPSERRATGTPVQRETISSTWLSLTVALTMLSLRASLSAFWSSSALSFASASGMA